MTKASETATYATLIAHDIAYDCVNYRSMPVKKYFAVSRFNYRFVLILKDAFRWDIIIASPIKSNSTV